MDVLQLERDWLWVDWLRSALTRQGHDVRVAGSEADALDALDRAPADVLLVGASFGHDVVTRVAKHARQAPGGPSVVALTHEHPSRRERAREGLRWVAVADGPERILDAIEESAVSRAVRAIEVESTRPEAAEARAGFLVVEDQEIESAVLRAVLSRHRPVTVASTIGRALGLLRSQAWTGVVIDLGLPDGSGLSVLRALREGGDATPALVLTATMSQDAINAVQHLGAEYVVKPPSPANLDRFIARAIADEAIDDANLTERLAAVARRYGLTQRETEIVALAARGAKRDEVASALGVAENTLKAQIRSILRKTEATSYVGMARLLLER